MPFQQIWHNGICSRQYLSIHSTFKIQIVPTPFPSHVALDKDAATGQALGVDGIPHSVIIDKKGVVRKVHVGFGPGMDGILKDEILQLLAE